MTQLNVHETMKQIFHVYQAGFIPFMTLSLLSMITIVGLTAFEVVILFSLKAALLILIAVLASIYLRLRASAGFYLLTRDILLGEKRTVKEAYRQTKGYAGTYFSIALLYSLILALPCIGIIFFYKYISSLPIKFGLIGLLSIPLAFLIVRYYLAIPSALLAGDSGGLESSKLLVKENSWRVLTVLVLTQGVIVGISQLLDRWAGSFTEMWLVILILVAQIILLFLTEPINGIASTIMYSTLNQQKSIDVLPAAISDQDENKSLL